MESLEIIKDDMVFKPYKVGGYQCLIPTSKGEISVRCDHVALDTTDLKPYEVWYPTKKNPTGKQTAEDIFKYIKRISKLK